jgi:hypothetical protein
MLKRGNLKERSPPRDESSNREMLVVVSREEKRG